MTTAPLHSKPHYPILDGLRGIAAIMVVAFHIFEAHATSHLDQIINHGYLAVDFFSYCLVLLLAPMMTGGVKCQLLIFSSAGLYVFNLWLLWG
jgi:hypothetical protein